MQYSWAAVAVVRREQNVSRREWFQVLAVTVVTACPLVLAGNVSAQEDSDNALERVKKVQERHTAKPAGVADTADNEVGAAVAFGGGGCWPGHAAGRLWCPSVGAGPRLSQHAAHNYGRATRLTTGRVRGVNANIRVQYGSRATRLVNQTMPEGDGFSATGGSRDTFVNPIVSVLDETGTSIDGQ